MPSIHVVLDCALPTREPDGRYHALVHVSDHELAAGEHIRRACRHASIRGFPGPHHFVAAWNAVTGTAISSASPALQVRVVFGGRGLRDRLAAVVDDAIRVATPKPRSPNGALRRRAS